MVMISTVVLTGVLFVEIPKGFFPQEDTGLIQGIAEGARKHLAAGDEGPHAGGSGGGDEGPRGRRGQRLYRTRRADRDRE